MNPLYKLLAVVALAATYASAETHVVSFDNRSVVALADSKSVANLRRYSSRCGSGTPTLISQNGQVLSTGESYVSNGPLIGAIA